MVCKNLRWVSFMIIMFMFIYVIIIIIIIIMGLTQKLI